MTDREKIINCMTLKDLMALTKVLKLIRQTASTPARITAAAAVKQDVKAAMLKRVGL